MVVGVLVGYYSSSATAAFNSVQIVTVSLPVSFGLWFMMYPVLVKVRYEAFGAIFRKRDTYRQLLFSVSANWVRAHFLSAHCSPPGSLLIAIDVLSCLCAQLIGLSSCWLSRGRRFPTFRTTATESSWSAWRAASRWSSSGTSWPGATRSTAPSSSPSTACWQIVLYAPLAPLLPRRHIAAVQGRR